MKGHKINLQSLISVGFHPTGNDYIFDDGVLIELQRYNTFLKLRLSKQNIIMAWIYLTSENEIICEVR